MPGTHMTLVFEDVQSLLKRSVKQVKRPKERLFYIIYIYDNILLQYILIYVCHYILLDIRC